MAVAAEHPTRGLNEGHFSLSGISVLMALGLCGWEIYFFWGAGRNLFGLDGSLGLFRIKSENDRIRNTGGLTDGGEYCLT
jgi:hypothetical protein